ncbi:MAG: IS66 family insertion sequence element accessory protein TnpB [Firmicutes bacterium]|nr:IS66 family insertion sequence element accessory protein TnpB [Bacillota bacterium]
MVNTREIAAEYRLSQWAKITQEREQSGLTIKAFCQKIGIGTNTYFYWQRKLREAVCQELLPAAKGSEKALVSSEPMGRSVPCPPMAPGWAMCKTEEPPVKKTLVIEIGVFRVQVEPDTDPELLAKTCRMLKSLC